MRALLLPLLLLPATAQAQQIPQDWHLDRVVVVMRHGIRPPTKAEPLPDTPHQPWPAWDVGWGELTHHGEQAVALLGSFDRQTYGALLGAGCPVAGAVHAVADTDQRTMRTAEVYVASLLPGCGVKVEHLAPGANDPRFSPSFAGAPSAPPAVDLAALDRQIAPLMQRLDAVVACGSATCALSARPTQVTMAKGRPKLSGALAIGGSLSETLALEYAEGKPLSDVGWGRADRATITDLLALHPGEYRLTARPLPIARAGSRVLLGAVFAALQADKGPAFSLFLGHDTNIALIGGALGLHWHTAQFAPDDPPPGGALIFERWRNGAGAYRLQLRFRAQTLDEMRNLAPPGPDAVQTLAFDGCTDPAGCDASGLARALSLAAR
jgi:4-phytase/acid phosphatase